MGSRYLTDLADVARRAGLDVVEDAGWQTRARGSGGYDGNRPWCVMWHHTASSSSWDGQRDADYIARGDPDAPLANLYVNRAGRVWVLAAGATNTNGKGGPLAGLSRGTVPADQMNTHAIGVELGNNGVGEAWPRAQVDAMFTLSNACAAAYGLAPSDCAGHVHWTTRKIDPATAGAVQGPWRPRAINSSGSWSLEDLRAECERRAANGGEKPETPPEGDDMAVIELWQLPDNPAVYVVDITRGGKLWLPTGEAVAARQALAQMYGQDPELKVQHDRDMFRAYGPIIGDARPGGVDEYGIPC